MKPILWPKCGLFWLLFGRNIFFQPFRPPSLVRYHTCLSSHAKLAKTNDAITRNEFCGKKRVFLVWNWSKFVAQRILLSMIFDKNGISWRCHIVAWMMKGDKSLFSSIGERSFWRLVHFCSILTNFRVFFLGTVHSERQTAPRCPAWGPRSR